MWFRKPPIGVVYDSLARKVLRVIVPDYSSELDDPSCVMPGETLLRVPYRALDIYNLKAFISEMEARL